MARITRFEEIEAWQTARELTRRVYELTNAGQFARDFGLRDQMRRASVSVMSNIAEGFESRTSAIWTKVQYEQMHLSWLTNAAASSANS